MERKSPRPEGIGTAAAPSPIGIGSSSVVHKGDIFPETGVQLAGWLMIQEIDGRRPYKTKLRNLVQYDITFVFRLWRATRVKDAA